VAQTSISPDADADLAENDAHLAFHAGNDVADRYYERFKRLFLLLSTQPEIGAPRPGLGRSVRINIVDPYNVYSEYDPASDAVTVLRVLHGRRKITRRMMRPN
jgi:toxin ParE1/3/4